jgi:arylsulfatase A-like enzyme/Flp pilus assembly protein TadD
VAFAALSCGGGEDASVPVAEPAPASSLSLEKVEVARQADLDVLLITIDTLRADAVGAYGKPQAGTPWMDRLAAEGVRFEAARAHNVVTLPSHASLLTGLLPQTHGVRDNAGFRFPAEVPTLATLLGAEGYRTGAFISAFPLDSRFGLATGFDVYEDSFVDAGVRPAFTEQERRAAATVALAQAWLEEGDGRPTFTWLHLYEPHYPWANGLYQSDVAAADAALAPLLAPLFESTGTLVVLTSDHGESLGEHGEATHGTFAYEGALRVPLVFFQPQLLPPRVVRSEVRLVDVMPTVLDLLGVSAPDDLDGESLLPLAAGVLEEKRVDTYFEALSGQLNRGWAPLYGVVRDGWKYIELPLPELYDLDADPDEMVNLVGSEAGRADELRAALADLREGDAGAAPAAESAETLERLRALGYVGGGSPPVGETYTEADDPKRLIELDERMREVAGLYEAGDLRGAAARSRELVRLRPGMRIALMQLAQVERDLGNLDAAIEAMSRAVELQPADPMALTLLTAYLTQAGRPGEAVELSAVAAAGEAPDVELLLTRSLALARLGRVEEAMAAVDRAAELEVANPLVPVYRGTVHLMSGRRAEASRAYEEALAINPSTVRALTALAVMATEEERWDDALGYWRRSVELDPREQAKLLGIAGQMWSAGRREQARPLLELFVSTAPPETYGDQIAQVRRLLAAD